MTVVHMADMSGGTKRQHVEKKGRKMYELCDSEHHLLIDTQRSCTEAEYTVVHMVTTEIAKTDDLDEMERAMIAFRRSNPSLKVHTSFVGESDRRRYYSGMTVRRSGLYIGIFQQGGVWSGDTRVLHRDEPFPPLASAGAAWILTKAYDTIDAASEINDGPGEKGRTAAKPAPFGAEESPRRP